MSTSTTPDGSVTPSQPNTRLPWSRIILAGVIAIVGSLIANLLIYFVGKMIVDAPADFLPLATVQPLIMFTVIFLVIATIVFGIITRISNNPARLFNIVAIVALIVGLIPDVMLLINPSAMPMGTPTLGAVLLLVLMHIASYAITVWVFTRWALSGATSG